MLEALKQQHPNRIALLDSIKQRVEQNWQRPLRESQSAQREALAQEPPFEGAWDKIKGIFKPAHRAPSPDPWPRSDAKKSVESDQTASPLVWTPRYFRDRLQSYDEGPEMAEIPAGSFIMGSPEKEPERFQWEGPQHQVTFTKPFALGRYAVTFDEYDRYCEAKRINKPHDQGWGRGTRPVIHVSWHDAKAYCEWLGQETGKNYRLPTEAEWEYACRAGTPTPFYFGDTISTEQTNYNAIYVYKGGVQGEYRKKTLAVGPFPPNQFGLYDMHGNVWEWCEDPWHDNYEGAPSDGSAWIGGNDSSPRVLRGGSWGDVPGWVRSAVRAGFTPGNRYGSLGFRLSRM
ncbi:MAG: formylglycine-generating enzyme family protein [Methylococcales bacterium]